MKSNNDSKRIFLSNHGQLAGIKSNLGEKAIFAQMLREIRKYSPNVKISVLSSSPSYTREKYGVDTVPLGGIIKGVISSLKPIMKCDILIVGGGELIQDKSSLAVIPYNLMRSVIAKLFRKKVVAYAVGIGEDDEITNFGKFLTKLVMNHFDLITVRDTKSKGMLFKLGITKPKIFEAADAANTLPIPSRKRTKEILEIEGITDVKKPIVAFSMRSVFHRTHNLLPFSYRKKFGLLPKNYFINITDFKEKIAKAADFIIEKYNVNIIFVPSYKGEKLSARDDEFSKEIIELIKNKNHTILIKKDYTPEEIKGLFSVAEFIIAVPLHSLILGGSANVPLIDINYASKGRAYMEQIGQQEYIIHVENPSDDFDLEVLIKLIEEVWKNRQDIRKVMEERNKIVFEKAQRSAKLLAKLINDEEITLTQF